MMRATRGTSLSISGVPALHMVSCRTDTVLSGSLGRVLTLCPLLCARPAAAIFLVEELICRCSRVRNRSTAPLFACPKTPEGD